MTDLEVIKNSVDVLGAISVPVGLLQSIGAPIYQVRQNLMLLLNALTEKSKDSNNDSDDNEQPESIEGEPQN